MEQKLDCPKTEYELRTIQDKLYEESKKKVELNIKPNYKGLLEIIKAEPNIVTCIHNIKSNKGSKTAGIDNKSIDDILTKNYDEVIKMVREGLDNYKPQMIKRVMIPKEGKNEMRPLGIPVIADRIIQECIRNILEPILEAQFFEHSYGFRPMREASMAVERVNRIIHLTGYHWVVEGDISKFFDEVNHNILIKRLWNMGINDKRVLMIIKQMLKAGIMNEVKRNEIGTPQGGIISPLLANVYLDAMDKWITREWENKKTKHQYSKKEGTFRALKKTNLKPAFLVRYADDWVLITNSKTNAEKWKFRIKEYLQDTLKLRLSVEKTKITNVRSKPIEFLGFDISEVRGKGKNGYVSNTKPNLKKVDKKIKKLRQLIKRLRKTKRFINKADIVHQINLINSQIRGIIEYYKCANNVGVVMNKFASSISFTSTRALTAHGGKLRPANQVDNLKSVHNNYTTTIPAIEYQNTVIGITSLKFAKWKPTPLKNQKETPYSSEGRKLYKKRTNKKRLSERADELLNLDFSGLIAAGKKKPKYNFEYLMNRAYAFNIDKGKCRVCRQNLVRGSVHTHHINPNLPLNEINKVRNLASVHVECHKLIHGKKELATITNKKVRVKVSKFRERLNTNSN